MNIGQDKLSFIKDALAKRRSEHKFRELYPVQPELGTSYIIREGKRLINFCSNDYLGLSQHPKVIERSVEFTQKYGAGSGASRLVSGSLTIHNELENKLAATFGTEAALVFNSGFQANTTLLPSLADRNSLIIIDRKCHNSLVQGAVLSRAEIRRFDHCNNEDLERILKQNIGKGFNRIWVITETIFSMDGDKSDLEDITRLCSKYEALLYSDDAHALGVLGDQGLGINYNMEGIDLSLGTFGKAFGGFGAFAACTFEMKDYLINYCPGFIYTTALPPSVIGGIEAALDLIPTMDTERVLLMANVFKVKEELMHLGYDLGESESQIIPVIIGSEQETLELSQFLEDSGVFASAIRPPTVEKDASRIRITISAMHTEVEISKLIDVFWRWKNR